MYEDSSDDEICLPYSKATTCWECGKYFRDLQALMVHYRLHCVNAHCHMCRITFRRKISLAMHLDNVHYPPICPKCSICFISAEELNRHAETDCKSMLFQDSPREKLEAQCPNHHGETSNALFLQDEKDISTDTETHESFEYTVGEDDDSYNNYEEDVDFYLDEESSRLEMEKMFTLSLTQIKIEQTGFEKILVPGKTQTHFTIPTFCSVKK